jgi:hypothetical protein
VALNLWKTGGKSTNYNPFPIGAININLTNIGDYRVIVKARSLTNGTILTLQWDDGGSQKELKSISLTTTTVEYVWDFTTDKPCPFYVIRGSGTPDIIIDSIELVQKPLPKLTLNGVDGFTSGKWTLHTNVKVIDDETLVLNATGTWQTSWTPVYSCSTGQTFTLSNVNGTGSIYVYSPNYSGTLIATISSGSTVTFTIPGTTFQIGLSNASTIGQVTFVKPMLNLGSTPAPYSRKTGDKMVLPVAKGDNLCPDFNSWTLSGSAQVVNGELILPNYSDSATSPFIRLTNTSTIRVTHDAYGSVVAPVSTVNTDGTKAGRLMNCNYYDANFNLVIGNSGSSSNGNAQAFPLNTYQQLTTTFSTGVQVVYCKITFQTTSAWTASSFKVRNVILNVDTGSVVNYTPYAVQSSKKPKKTTVKARTGLAFNGTSDYLQLPSMTMDSVEIDCLIDVNQPFNGSNIFDARDGLLNGWVGIDTSSGGVFSSAFTFTKGVRQKVLIKTSNPFTDNVIIFSDRLGTPSKCTKGILYKVTCYLGNQVVAQYDFENPSNIAGTSVLQKGINLIPNFEDARWVLPPNTQVLGKHALRLNATSGYQNSTILIPALPNTSYMFSGNVLGGVSFRNNGITTLIAGANKDPYVSPFVFTTPSDCTQLGVLLFNPSGLTSGTFDFNKPQLYQLTGNEGTVSGAPRSGYKPSRRTQYAKR